METKQKILETNFKRIFRLKDDFRLDLADAKRKNDEIQNRVRDIVAQEKFEAEEERKRLEQKKQPSAEPILPNVRIVHEVSDSDGGALSALPPPALPEVSYEWKDKCPNLR